MAPIWGGVHVVVPPIRLTSKHNRGMAWSERGECRLECHNTMKDMEINSLCLSQAAALVTLAWVQLERIQRAASSSSRVGCGSKLWLCRCSWKTTAKEWFDHCRFFMDWIKMQCRSPWLFKEEALIVLRLHRQCSLDAFNFDPPKFGETFCLSI